MILEILAWWFLASVIVAVIWAGIMRDRCTCEWCESRRTSLFECRRRK